MKFHFIYVKKTNLIDIQSTFDIRDSLVHQNFFLSNRIALISKGLDIISLIRIIT